MGQDAVPFFTPIRLRGTVYDRFHNNQWLQSPGPSLGFPEVNGAFRIAE